MHCACLWKDTLESCTPCMGCVRGSLSRVHPAMWELLAWNQSHSTLDCRDKSTERYTAYWPDAWWQTGDCGGQETWSIAEKMASEAGEIIFKTSDCWLLGEFKVQWTMLWLDKLASKVSWKWVAGKPCYLTSSSASTEFPKSWLLFTNCL